MTVKISNEYIENSIRVIPATLPELDELIGRSFPQVEPLPEAEREDHREYQVLPDELLPLCRALKAAGFGFLADITAVDYLAEGSFRLLYQIFNFRNGSNVTLRLDIPREEPRVESLCGVWPAANWPEREVYDMFGIVFAGHPQLERILMWEGFAGWPLRKDFVHQPSKYQGRRRLDPAPARQEQNGENS